MRVTRRSIGGFDWVELLAGAGLLAGCAQVAWTLLNIGYLPQPFFYDTADTLMDFHHTAYWSHTDRAYSVWGSIYPPLSFALLRFLTPAACYLEDPLIGRDCNWMAPWLLVLAIVLTGLLVLRANARSPVPIAWCRALLVCLGLPMLFGLERGNLILLAIPAVLYALLAPRFGWRAAFALAWAINLKPYLVLLLAAVWLTRDHRAFARGLAASALLYAAAVIVVGDGMPWHLLTNITSFAGDGVFNLWERFYFSSSLVPLMRILDSELPIVQYVDLSTAEAALVAIKVVLQASLWLSMAALLSLLVRDKKNTDLRSAAVLLALLGLAWTESLGGYAIAFATAGLAIGGTPGALNRCALLLAYAVSIPSEWILSIVREGESTPWISGLAVETTYGVGVGQVGRPCLLIVMLWLVALQIAAPSLKNAFVTLASSTQRFTFLAPRPTL